MPTATSPVQSRTRLVERSIYANPNSTAFVTVTACGPDTSDLRSESARMTIAVEKTSHNGFADLSITAHVTKMESDGDNHPDADKRTVRTVVEYDGKSNHMEATCTGTSGIRLPR